PGTRPAGPHSRPTGRAPTCSRACSDPHLDQAHSPFCSASCWLMPPELEDDVAGEDGEEGEDGDEAEPDGVPEPLAEPEGLRVGVPGGLFAEITSDLYFLGSGLSFRITFHSPLAAGDH